MDIVNHELFKQAYKASIDAIVLLDHYEISKLLTGPYDKEGACVIITAGSEGVASELWAEKIFCMYRRWAENHGYKELAVEVFPSTSGGIKSAVIEIEREYIFGYLSGENGTHKMVCSSSDNNRADEVSTATVDIIPLFLDRPVDLRIEDTDVEISPLTCEYEHYGRSNPAVSICHIASGITVQSSGQRTHFANKLKALNRLKAKLLVMMEEQGISDVKKMKKNAVLDRCNQETRRYVIHPQKRVHDLKTGIRVTDLDLVLDGNIESFIRGSITIRHESEFDSFVTTD